MSYIELCSGQIVFLKYFVQCTINILTIDVNAIYLQIYKLRKL